MPINLETISFVVLAAMAVGGGIGVALLRNLFHAALCLVLALFGVAGMFILLSAPFLGLIQILVYMGAISILIIFVIMLTQDAVMPKQFNRQWIVGGLVAAALFVVLAGMIMQLGGGAAPYWQPEPLVYEMPGPGIVALGADLVDPGRYVLPFEVAGMLLTVALVGAISIARED